MISNASLDSASEKARNHSTEVVDKIDTTCCVVGAGPAGAVLALLLARQGISLPARVLAFGVRAVHLK